MPISRSGQHQGGMGWMQHAPERQLVDGLRHTGSAHSNKCPQARPGNSSNDAFRPRMLRAGAARLPLPLLAGKEGIAENSELNPAASISSKTRRSLPAKSDACFLAPHLRAASLMRATVARSKISVWPGAVSGSIAGIRLLRGQTRPSAPHAPSGPVPISTMKRASASRRANDLGKKRFQAAFAAEPQDRRRMLPPALPVQARSWRAIISRRASASKATSICGSSISKWPAMLASRGELVQHRLTKGVDGLDLEAARGFQGPGKEPARVTHHAGCR